MTIFEKIAHFVDKVFKTTLEIFLEALKLSPNAQGYVSGSITELLLKKELEDKYGFEVVRIKEKWEGKKHPQHRGDFYFHEPDSENWYVIESKGIKSNSEKWHKLYNYQKLKSFLFNHADKLPWIDKKNEKIEEQIIAWLEGNLPDFQEKYADKLYEFGEVQSYKSPKRETEKSLAIDKLRDFSREEINQMIVERLGYVHEKMRVLETHFVSGTSGASSRTQATPRKDEFNAISIDVFLNYHEHKFLYANPRNLESSGSDENHLQQNYIMGFVFIDEQGEEVLSITDEWYEDFSDVYATLEKRETVNVEDMQIDHRYDINNGGQE